MKKINCVCLLVLLMAVTLLFAGCEILEQPFPIGTEADSGSLLHPEKTDSEATGAPVETPAQETEAETADPYEGLSSAKRQIREIADKALRAKYDIPSLEHFSVEVTDFSDSYSVRYVLMIHGYETGEHYSVDLTKTLTVESVYGFHSGQYACYLETATAEAIKAAEEKLGRGGSGPYLSIDNEGYLCLSLEEIVPITPETDENGNEIMEGCGDHKHEFYHERICPKP